MQQLQSLFMQCDILTLGDKYYLHCLFSFYDVLKSLFMVQQPSCFVVKTLHAMVNPLHNMTILLYATIESLYHVVSSVHDVIISLYGVTTSLCGVVT